MKKALLFFTLLSFTYLSYAQSSARIAGMKITKFGLSATYDEDMIRDIGADYFIGVSKDGIEADIEDVNFRSQDIYSMVCENPAIRAELTLQPFRSLKNISLNTGASFMFNRNDASYYNFYYNTGVNDYNNIRFSSYSNELALDASLLYHQKFLFLHLYGGVGTNLGMTFAGRMTLEGAYKKETTVEGSGTDGGESTQIEYIDFREEHQMKNLLHQRVFLQGGATIITFGRLELGLEGRIGIGYRAASDVFAVTELHSAGFVAKWCLK